MSSQIFLLPKMKISAIISDKHGIYELPYELLNDFEKISKLHRMIT